MNLSRGFQNKLYLGINTSEIPMFWLGVLFLWGSSATVRVLFHAKGLLTYIYAFIFLYYGIKTFNEKKNNPYIVSLFVFYAINFLATAIGENHHTLNFYIVENIGVTLFINYELEKDAYKLTKNLENAAIFTLIVNLLLLAIKPNGIAGTARTAYYFLGFRIAFTPFVFVAVFLAVIMDRMNGKKLFSKKTILVLALSVVTLVWKDVGTGLVSIVIFVGLSAYVLILNRRIFNIWAVYIGYLIGAVSIIVFGVQNNVPFLRYILEDVLGRDTTFDNRTYIWYSTMYEFLNKPILGHGTDFSAMVYLPPYTIKKLPAHNQLLCVLSDTGVIGFIAFLAMFAIVGISISKIKSFKCRGIMVAAILAELMIFFTEIQMTKCLIFIVLIYVYRSKDFLADSFADREGNI